MYLIIIDHIELDREQRSVRRDGEEIHLTGYEYGLLAFHKNALCMPTGPRLYFGFMFCH